MICTVVGGDGTRSAVGCVLRETEKKKRLSNDADQPAQSRILFRRPAKNPATLYMLEPGLTSTDEHIGTTLRIHVSRVNCSFPATDSTDSSHPECARTSPPRRSQIKALAENWFASPLIPHQVISIHILYLTGRSPRPGIMSPKLEKTINRLCPDLPEYVEVP